MEAERRTEMEQAGMEGAEAGRTEGGWDEAKRRNRERLLGLLLLCGAAFVLLLLNLFYLENWLDSDMAAEMIFSRLLLDERKVIATGSWFYSTEFRVLYTQLIMEPLFVFLKSWHWIRLITNVCTYGLLLASYLYMVRPLRLRRGLELFSALLLFVPFSETIMLHVHMGNTYMPHMILIFFVFGLFLRLTPAGEKKLLPVGLYVLLCLICGVSGVRYVLALQAPLFLSSLILQAASPAFPAFRRKPGLWEAKALLEQEEIRYVFYSGGGLAAAMAGYLINTRIIRQVFVFQTYEAVNFVHIYQGSLTDRLQDTFGSLIMLFGYIPGKGFLSLRGVITLCGMLILAGLVYVWNRLRHILSEDGGRNTEPGKRDQSRRFLLLFVGAAFVLNSFVFVFTTSTIVPRYYITVVMFMAPLLGIYWETEELLFDRRGLTLLMAAALTLSAAKTTYSFMTTDKNEDKKKVSAFLEDQGYDFGYGTYWNANIMTELTDGAVEVANLWDVEEGSFFRWSSPAKYYDADYRTGKVFVLLTRQEYEEHAGAAIVRDREPVYEDEGYVVLHFDSNEDFRTLAEGSAHR